MNRWMVLGLIAWTPVFYFSTNMIKSLSQDRGSPIFSEGPQSGSDGSTNDVPRNLECKDGTLTNGMPCPTKKANNNRDARTISNISNDTVLTLYADAAGEKVSTIYGLDGVAHFFSGINSDIIKSNNVEVIKNGKWVGSSVGIACKVERIEAQKKSKITCGEESVEVLDGQAGASAVNCTVTKTGNTARITCPTGSADVTDGANGVNGINGVNGKDCKDDDACVESVKNKIIASTDVKRKYDIGNDISNRLASKNAVCNNSSGFVYRSNGYYKERGTNIYRYAPDNTCFHCVGSGDNQPGDERCCNRPTLSGCPGESPGL